MLGYITPDAGPYLVCGLGMSDDSYFAAMVDAGFAVIPSVSGKFGNGESRFEIDREAAEGSLDYRDVYVLQSMPHPEHVLEDLLMNLCIMVFACRQLGRFRQIHALVPCLPFQREPTRLKLAAVMLKASGAHMLTTFGLETEQMAGIFDIPVRNVDLLPMLAEWINGHLGGMVARLGVMGVGHQDVKKAGKLLHHLRSSNSQLVLFHQGRLFCGSWRANTRSGVLILYQSLHASEDDFNGLQAAIAAGKEDFESAVLVIGHVLPSRWEALWGKCSTLTMITTSSYSGPLPRPSTWHTLTLSLDKIL